LPAEIRLSIRQVALHRSEDAADQVVIQPET
jgi:glycerol-3-phosphate O-acyltransferase